MFRLFIHFNSLWQRSWKLNLILVFHLKCVFSIRIFYLIFYFKLWKGITRIIKSLNKFSFIIIWIKIPSTSKHNHLNFISLMSSLLKRIKSIIDLFYWIKLIEPSSHRSRFWFDITLWHFRIIWTKDTMTRTRIGLSQNLHTYNSWHWSNSPFTKQKFKIWLFLNLPFFQKIKVYL